MTIILALRKWRQADPWGLLSSQPSLLHKLQTSEKPTGRNAQCLRADSLRLKKEGDGKAEEKGEGKKRGKQ